MKLTREEVEHVAWLARLALTEEEKELFRAQLGAILEYMEVLNRLDTEDVPPTYHVLPLKNVWRPDEAGPCIPREEALANAPDREGAYFRVPRII